MDQLQSTALQPSGGRLPAAVGTGGCHDAGRSCGMVYVEIFKGLIF